MDAQGHPVTVFYLAMDDASQLRAAREPEIEGLALVHAQEPSAELHRFLYTAVGGDWHWTDRLDWSYERWDAYARRQGCELWVATVRGTPAGYFELEFGGEAANICYFGLLPAFIGRGLGGWLLTRALERAWEHPSVRRVTVNTCTLDGPHALANYRARGLSVAREVVTRRRLGARPPGPWPGAR